jgi:steroid 5-alpha reductase family enzyme
MTKTQIIIAIFAVTTIGILIAAAGSQNGQEINGIPIFAICVATAFAINWLAFIPAYFLQTEKFYDLTGSFTYISVTILALFLSENLDARTIALACLVWVWAARLGTFLFRRIHQAGKDDRFDSIKPSFARFLNAWTIQALWVVFTAAPVFIAITAQKREPLGVLAIIGLAVWAIGFAIEVVADYQKTQFRRKEENKGKFIQTGLWARSRHPNYFGEIVLWIGVTIMAIPVLQGWQWIALISPVFVIILLTRISGVPMLEEKADQKWGGQEEYESYKANTPVLVPRI